MIDELVGRCYDKEVNSSFLMAAFYDGRGSVAGLTGNTGGSMITYRYDAYGNTTKSNNTLNNPYQYNAEYTDSSTELQYLRARYYDSSQGRFTTKDTLLGSIEKPITRNLYTYCGNNPLNITDPSGHSWISRAWNGVKSAAKTAGNWANKHIVQPVKKAANTAVNWANTHVVQPIKNRITNSAAYQKGKQYVEKKYQEVKQTYNTVTNYVSNKAQQFYNDYVPPKMQKAIEEAKRFVCTTTDRIVKDAKEFIQNVDWKKVAIGVAATAAITLAVVATGGAAAPVLIGAAVGAGISTGTTVVSGVIQGKSPAEIAKDASGAFMWGAIGGAVGGGTAQIGTKALGKVGKKLVENGVDMAVDLTQTAVENGGLTGKDVLFSAVTSFGGDLLGSAKTNSTTRNQLIDGATDNKAVKNAVKDSATDSSNIKRNAKFDDVIDSVENGNVKLSNNIQKGNYGEMKMDQYFESQGYTRISNDRVTGLNDSTHHGIDGVYSKTVDGKTEYVIGEAKYGTSKLGNTKDGKQMSDSWITGSNRLNNAVGEETSTAIMNSGYSRQVINVKPDGTIKVKIL